MVGMLKGYLPEGYNKTNEELNNMKKIEFDRQAAMLADKRQFYGEFAEQIDIDVYNYIADRCVRGDGISPTFTNSEIKRGIKYPGKAEDIGNAIAYLRRQRILWYKHQVTGNKRHRRGSGRYKARAIKVYEAGDEAGWRFDEHLFAHFKQEEMV